MNAQPSSSDDLDDPTLEADVFAKACTSRPVLQNVAGRWGTLALVALRDGPYRFSALRRRVDGISERMLAQTLHALERDGMVHREVHETIPPRVEYTLTDLGAEIADHLENLVQAVEANMPKVREAQAAYDRH
ncbi:winged helix-turn-helix transcriptional regulator [Nocardia callitridis]